MVKVAVCKNNVDKIKNIDGVEYVYIFNDEEKIQDLLNLNLQCVNYRACKYVDINLTPYNIECIKIASIEDKDFYKLPEKVFYKIGIIVPNYNYSEWLGKCLDSIASQTYKNFEVIYVDDMSTDNSVEIAKSFINKMPGMKVVELQQKRFNGGARNEAYLHLSEDVDYVWYVDSDDWLIDNNVLEDINDKLQRKPDVLFVGLAMYKEKKTTTARIPNYKTKYDALEGWSGSCGKVIKKSLATRQECLYNEGTLKEDKNQHCRICIYMNSFNILPKPVYVWNRENGKSVTTIREQIFWGTSTIRHYADTMQLYLSEKGKDRTIDEILERRLNLCKQEVEQGNDRQY